MEFKSKTGKSWNWSQAYESSLLELPTGSGDTKCCSLPHAPFQAKVGIGQSCRVLTHQSPKHLIPHCESRSAERKFTTGMPISHVSLFIRAAGAFHGNIPHQFVHPSIHAAKCGLLKAFFFFRPVTHQQLRDMKHAGSQPTNHFTFQWLPAVVSACCPVPVHTFRHPTTCISFLGRPGVLV